MDQQANLAGQEPLDIDVATGDSLDLPLLPDPAVTLEQIDNAVRDGILLPASAARLPLDAGSPEQRIPVVVWPRLFLDFEPIWPTVPPPALGESGSLLTDLAGQLHRRQTHADTSTLYAPQVSQKPHQACIVRSLESEVVCSSTATNLR